MNLKREEVMFVMKNDGRPSTVTDELIQKTEENIHVDMYLMVNELHER